MRENILLIDKPVGMSSFDVIRRLRPLLKGENEQPPKLGHAGTLDPLASGLLLIGVSEGTKVLSDLLKLPKTYEASIVLGKASDTGDSEGRITERLSVAHVLNKDIETAVKDMVGTHNLPVPAYSAVKQDGEPLYKKARRGEEVQPPVKEMTVTAAELLGVTKHPSAQAGDDEIELYMRFDVESGTYIRSLAEELGKKLNVPAMLTSLRRTKIGDYDIQYAKTLADFEPKEKQSPWTRFFRAFVPGKRA